MALLVHLTYDFIISIVHERHLNRLFPWIECHRIHNWGQSAARAKTMMPRKVPTGKVREPRNGCTLFRKVARTTNWSLREVLSSNQSLLSTEEVSNKVTINSIECQNSIYKRPSSIEVNRLQNGNTEGRDCYNRENWLSWHEKPPGGGNNWMSSEAMKGESEGKKSTTLAGNGPNCPSIGNFHFRSRIKHVCVVMPAFQFPFSHHFPLANIGQPQVMPSSHLWIPNLYGKIYCD